MELLAPAGNKEALIQAIANGADAVYLGYTAFSARQGAGNFDKQEISEAIALAHLYHVRVYVALNTLIKESEWPALDDAVKVIEASKADAVIVQDLGVASLIRRKFPLLPIHASTQMALHNAQGARFAKKMGFSRVVMARECPLSEIRLACKEGVEIEVFVHGAMCVCQSGECLFSSMVGSRSGNRGRCAQPCRMDYWFEGKKGAWLSPRDMMLRDDLPLFEKAGVTSLKIEGRLKRPEYVSEVVASYRRALTKQSLPVCDEREKLLQIFNRGGFMRGHAMGQEDADIVYPARVNHMGVPLGQVIGMHNGMARIRLEKPLHNGDSLRFEGMKEIEAVYSGKELTAGECALCRLRESADIPIGTAVTRLLDSEQMKNAIRELPKIPVDMRLKCVAGEPMALSVYDTTVSGDIVQAAQKSPATAEGLETLLRKAGGTAFHVRGVSIQTQNAFAPVSVINQLRRDALLAYESARAEGFYKEGQKALPPLDLHAIKSPSLSYEKAVRSDNPADFSDSTLNLFEPLCYDDAMLEGLDTPVWLCLPMMCTAAELGDIVKTAEAAKGQIQGLVLQTIGQYGVETSLPLAAAEGIPVWNKSAADLLLSLGFRFFIASPELSLSELEALRGYPLLAQTTGRVRLMTLSHCPRRTAMGLKKDRAGCRLCEQRPLPPLSDRMNAAFPLKRTRLKSGCKIAVMNSVPLDNENEEPRLRALGFVPLHEGDAPTGASTKGHLYHPVE